MAIAMRSGTLAHAKPSRTIIHNLLSVAVEHVKAVRVPFKVFLLLLFQNIQQHLL